MSSGFAYASLYRISMRFEINALSQDSVKTLRTPMRYIDTTNYLTHLARHPLTVTSLAEENKDTI